MIGLSFTNLSGPLSCVQMEGQGREMGEGQGNNPTDSVNMQLVATLTQLVEFFKRQETRVETIEIADDVALERFQKFGPPKFNGEANEEVAERWMDTMENIYAVLRYTEERKVRFGVFQLEGPARAWWRIVQRKWEQEGKPSTWNAFLEEFKNKFIPQVVRDRNEKSFLNLIQGSLTVTQYEVQFAKLSQYALDMVNTEENMIKRFLQGLDPEIQKILVPARLDTYAKVVELAQKAEDCLGKSSTNPSHEGPDLKRTKSIMENISQGQVGTQLIEPRDRLKNHRIKASNPRLDERKKSQVRCRYCRFTNHTENECRRKES